MKARLVQLGYAARIGWDQIICVINTAYGGVELMPFDLRPRRLLVYHLPEKTSDKPQRKRELTSDLQKAIEIIIHKNYTYTQVV